MNFNWIYDEKTKPEEGEKVLALVDSKAGTSVNIGTYKDGHIRMTGNANAHVYAWTHLPLPGADTATPEQEATHTSGALKVLFAKLGSAMYAHMGNTCYSVGGFGYKNTWCCLHCSEVCDSGGCWAHFLETLYEEIQNQ